MRVAELLEKSAARAEISVASVTEALLRIAAKAEEIKDSAGLSVARAAQMDVAKLNGLVIDRTELDSVQRILSDKPQSDEEWARAHEIDLGTATRPAALSH